MTATSIASFNSANFGSAPLTSREKRLVVGNWKMNGSLASNAQLLDQIKQGVVDISERVNIAVCASFPYLMQVSESLDGTSVTWGAQNVSAHESGAFTGEVSVGMLSDFACRWVLVGHSERRSLNGETDAAVAEKAQAALSGGLTPIVCVGESLQERDSGEVRSVIERQLKPMLALGVDALSRVVIAYEPVWAIGTGRSASPEQAQEVHGFIRAMLTALDGKLGDVPLLYGGSVKPENADVLFGMPDIDGALVGGASLVAKDFIAIAVHGASRR